MSPIPEPLEADLELTITNALSAVDELASAMTDSLGTAIATVDEDFTLFASTAPAIQVDADTDAALDQLAMFDAAATTPIAVPVDGDTGAAVDQLDLFHTYVESTPAVVPVDADTSDAQAAVEELTGATSEGRRSADDYGAAIGLVGATAGLARGEVSGAASAVGGLSGASAVGIGAVAGFAGTIGFLYAKGVEATGMLQRFDMLVGDMAGQVLNVNVGSLNAQLDELAIKLGTDDEKLRNANASVFQFAINSGASQAEAAKFANQLTAIGARGVALKPSLGGVDSAVESLSVRLARGGRFAQNYGVSLTASEITTRALADTHKASAGELSIYEKATAAADLAVEKYGSTIQKTVNEGSKNAIIQQRSLREQMDNIFEEVGKPLVAPIFELIKSSLPNIKALATSIGDLAISALPALKAGLDALVPILTLSGTLLEGVTSATDALGISSTATGAAIGFMVAGPWGALVGAFGGMIADLGGFDSGMRVATVTAAELSAQSEKLAKALNATNLPTEQVESYTKAWEHFLKVSEKRGDFDYNTAGDNVRKAAVGIAQGLGVASGYVEHHTSLMTPLLAQYKTFKSLAEQNVGAAQNLITSLKAQGVDTTLLERVLANETATQKLSTTATQSAEESTALLTGSYEEQIAVLEKKQDAMLAEYDVQFAAIHAAENERDAIDKLNTAYDESIKSGKTREEALEAQRRAETAAEESVVRATQAVKAKSLQDYESLGAQAAAEQATKDQIGSLEALRDTLAPGSDLQKFVQSLIDKLSSDALNKPHKTAIEIETEEAQKRVDTFIASLNTVPAGTYYGVGVTGPTESGHAAVGAYVPATAGGSWWNVGEGGSDELIIPTDNRARAMQLLEQGGLSDLAGGGIDYAQLAAAIAASGAGAAAPLIGTAHFVGAPIADLDYFMKTRMAGV